MEGYYSQPLPAKTFDDILKDFPPGSYISDVQTVNSRVNSSQPTPVVANRLIPMANPQPDSIVYPTSQVVPSKFLPTSTVKTQSSPQYSTVKTQSPPQYGVAPNYTGTVKTQPSPHYGKVKTQSPPQYGVPQNYAGKKPVVKYHQYRGAQAARQEYIPKNYGKVESLPAYPANAVPAATQPKYSEPPAAQPKFTTPPEAQPNYTAPAQAARQEYIPKNYGKVESLPQYSATAAPSGAQPTYTAPPAEPAKYTAPPAAQPKYAGPPAAQPKYTAPPQASEVQQKPIPTYTAMKSYRQPIIAKTQDGSKKKIYFEQPVNRGPVTAGDARSPVKVATTGAPIRMSPARPQPSPMKAPIRISPARPQPSPLKKSAPQPASNEFIARVRSPSGNVRTVPVKPIASNNIQISSSIQTEDEPNLQQRVDMDSKMHEMPETDRYIPPSGNRQSDAPYNREIQTGSPYKGPQNRPTQDLSSPDRKVVHYEPRKEPQPREVYRDDRNEPVHSNLQHAPEAPNRPQEYNEYYRNSDTLYSSQKVKKRVFPRESISKALQTARYDDQESEQVHPGDEEQNDNNPNPEDSESWKEPQRAIRPPQYETRWGNQPNTAKEDNMSLAELKARREAELREQQHAAYYNASRGSNQPEAVAAMQVKPESKQPPKPVYNPDAPIPKSAFPTVIKHSYGPPRPSQGTQGINPIAERGQNYSAPVNEGPTLQTFADIEKAKMLEYNQQPAVYRGDVGGTGGGWYQGLNKANKSQMRYNNERVRRSAIPPSGISSKAGWKRGSIDSESGWKR